MSEQCKQLIKIGFLGVLLCGFAIGKIAGNINQVDRHIYRTTQDSIGTIEQRYEQAAERGDTTQAITDLVLLGELYSHRAQYTRSYEYLWSALLMADSYDDTLLLAQVHSGIGWLYSYYERRAEALYHFNLAIAFKKVLIAQERIPVNELISEYYGITTFYRELGDTDGARIYLDSCYTLLNQTSGDGMVPSFLDAELAYYYIQTHDFQEALRLIEKVRPSFTANRPTYLVLLNAFEGDAHKGLGNYAQSEYLYLQALDIANRYDSHRNHIPAIHERLANLYFITGNYKKAYESLYTAKNRSEALFDSRSLNNRPLLEITDAFRRVKEEKRLLLQEQRLQQLEQEERINVMRNIMLLGVLVVVLLLSGGYLRYIKVRHRAKEELNRKSRELEMKNNLELISLKNKELASSALRLIEKDKMLQELKKHISSSKNPSDFSDIKRIMKGITASSNQNWEEFEARFVEVNEKFYKHLKEKHSDLTPGDLKLCALIKLNFNSKEMAGLLGIGVESVHTIRYRLRKKLGLTRKENLTEYLFEVDGME